MNLKASTRICLPILLDLPYNPLYPCSLSTCKTKYPRHKFLQYCRFFGTLAIDISLFELLIFMHKPHFIATLIYCSPTHRPFRSPHHVNYRSLQCHPHCVDDLCIRRGVFVWGLRGWGCIFVASSLSHCMQCRKALTGWLIYTCSGPRLFIWAFLSPY